MSFLKNITELADLLGFANLYQNVNQSKELKILKKLIQNQMLMMSKLDEIEKKEKDNV